MIEMTNENTLQLQRVYYKVDHVRVPNVANSIERTDDDTFRSDREMSICEMQQEFTTHERSYSVAKHDLRTALIGATREATTGAPASANFVIPSPSSGELPTAQTVRSGGRPLFYPRSRGLARSYCEVVARLAGIDWPTFAMRSAHAAVPQQDTTKRDLAPTTQDSSRARARAIADSIRRAGAGNFRLRPGPQPERPATELPPRPTTPR